jgi:hypothetical protein
VEHSAQLAQATAIAASVRYVTAVLRELLEVVAITGAGVLDDAARRTNLEVLVALLAELGAIAPHLQLTEIKRLHIQLVAALPNLLAFFPRLDTV